jgi:AAA domain, putative AbiEii toxin, Type IV TA system
MNRLIDFKPLAKVTLPGVGGIPCSGLTLVVGPNSSGKTHLLTDLYLRLCGEPRKLVVASDVRVDKPEYTPLMNCLESEGYIRKYTNPDNNQTQIIGNTTYVGTGTALQPINPSQAEEWYHAYTHPAEGVDFGPRNQFLSYFGRLLVTKLFLDRRLIGFRTVGVIDFESQPPTDDLHAFHVNDSAREQLSAETIDAFGKAVWSDSMRGTMLCLRVCEGELPNPNDRLSFKKMSDYRTIESEGDGLKSYVAICIALLLGQRPICLIDEPEMCLHPPQAYILGRFIGRHGSSKEIATFVATHSSQILRGVVQSTKDVEIIRLTRSSDQFVAHHVPADELVKALEKPTLRAESVLDGIFSESVVVVEADSDRLVYNATWETLSNELRLDVHFAAVGGIGGIADTCKLYRTLHIPVVVIADLDMVTTSGALRRVLDAMAEPQVASVRP